MHSAASALWAMDCRDEHVRQYSTVAMIGSPDKGSVPLKPAQHRELSQLLRRLINGGVSLKLPAYHSLIRSKVDHDVVLGQGAPKRFLRIINVVNERPIGIIRSAKILEDLVTDCMRSSCAHDRGYEKIHELDSTPPTLKGGNEAPNIPLFLS